MTSRQQDQESAEAEVDGFRHHLGPFAIAAETTPMPVIFTNAKVPDNPIVFANDSFLRLTGYRREEIVGKAFNFLMAEVTEPDALARIEAEFTNEGNRGESLEIECRRNDGRHFLAAVYITPVPDHDGTIVRHCATFIDLSVHLDRLRIERDELHALYQHAPGFIATTKGPNHCFTFANDAYQKFVGHWDIVGKTVAQALPEVVEQGFIEILDAVYATGEPFVGKGMPIQLQRLSDETADQRYMDFVYQPVRNSRDEIIGLFCEGHDVTEQKSALDQVLALQTELIHLSRVSAMGTMATTLAHELNQPLAAISNYMAGCRRLVDAGSPEGEALDKGLNAIGQSAARAGDIIRRLRDMTKRGKSHRETFDLTEAIRESVELVRVGACEGVNITYEEGAHVRIEADRVQIQQVIMNLARNACEAVASMRGKVTVSYAVKGNRVVIMVQDDGSGVPPDVVETLFAWTDSAKPDSMGVGLSISRTIVESHEGNIWLEHSGDSGSLFCFSLPVGRCTDRATE